MNLTEKKLAEINTGRMAGILEGHLEPILAELEAAAIAQIKNQYRQGDFDQVKMLVGVGQLATIDDMRAKIKAQINSGIAANKELRNES